MGGKKKKEKYEVPPPPTLSKQKKKKKKYRSDNSPPSQYPEYRLGPCRLHPARLSSTFRSNWTRTERAR